MLQKDEYRPVSSPAFCSCKLLYVIIKLDELLKEVKNEEEKIDIIADRILLENIEAFKELAK